MNHMCVGKLLYEACVAVCSSYCMCVIELCRVCSSYCMCVRELCSVCSSYLICVRENGRKKEERRFPPFTWPWPFHRG